MQETSSAVNTNKASIRFLHGLGDCSNFAHLVKLYVDKGYDLHVKTDDTKQVLFLAAGAKIPSHGLDLHLYLHPPSAGHPLQYDHWSGNKLAFNISRPPMPDIGHYSKIWDEVLNVKLDLDAYVTLEKSTVEDFYRDLPRPIILVHPQGNTSPHSKSLDHAQQQRLFSKLLDETNGTIVLLDWDSRVFSINSRRVRHQDYWRQLTTLELYEAIKQADLLIGCDSGPLHFARFTDTPAVGIWTGHHPSQFYLPRKQTLNVCDRRFNALTRYRRLAYNIVESPGDSPDGAFIGEQAVKMLGGRKYLPDATQAEDCVLQWLVSKVRTDIGDLSQYIDRNKTFDLVFRLARERGLKNWVETGCIRSQEDWTAGFSTYIFGYYLSKNGGHLDSVDLTEHNVLFAQEWTSQLDSVTVHNAHSHDFIRAYDKPIDLLYLDSQDVGCTGYEQNCLIEFDLARERLHKDSLVLIDDTVYSSGKWRGKGATLLPYALKQGYKILYSGYQCLLSLNAD